MVLGYTTNSEQAERLRADGCARVQTSGLPALLATLRRGDVLVVLTLVDFDRKVSDLVLLLQGLLRHGINFRVMEPRIDSDGPHRSLIIPLIETLAGLDPTLTKARRLAPLRRAHARGNIGGRPYAASQADIVDTVSLYNQKQISVTDGARTLGVSHTSMRRYITGVNSGRITLPAAERSAKGSN